jgi:group I intron endonuclease
MNTIGIYKVTSPSGKVYVGQSWNTVQRWAEYRKPCFLSRSKQSKLAASFKKHGVEAHLFEIIEEFSPEVSQAVLDQREQFHMDRLRAEGMSLLNIREGGSRGKLTAETIDKIVRTRRANGSYIYSQELKDEWSRQRKGRPGAQHSEATKQKLSALAAGRVPSDLAKERNRQSQLGRKHSAASKLKIGNANRGRKRPDLSRRNQLAAAGGRSE